MRVGGSGAMTLSKFILGMILVTVGVFVWSLADGISLGAAILRAVLCLVILQVGYFVYVLVRVNRERRQVQLSQQAKPEEASYPEEGRKLPQ